MEHYDNFSKVGEGAFGLVYRAVRKTSGQVVAIKRVARGRASDGAPFVSIREIKLLQELKHPNIVSLVEAFFSAEGDLHIVYEFYEGDLEQVIRLQCEPAHYTPADIKAFMLNILEGVRYLHSVFILHRDLKPNNIFLSNSGKLALGDFGLAKAYGDDKELSPQAITIYYRPPEMLMGAKYYGPAVDMWSVACIFAELWLRKPLFTGTSELDMLRWIFGLLGTPTEADWPGHSLFSNFIQFESLPATPLIQVFQAAPPDAVHLLSAMLKCDPNKRLTAEQALQHPYFTQQPAPSRASALPKPLPIGKRKQLAEQQEHEMWQQLQQQLPL